MTERQKRSSEGNLENNIHQPGILSQEDKNRREVEK